METLKWETFFNRKNIHGHAKQFNEIIFKICNNFVQNNKVTISDNNPPWMNEMIKSKIMEKKQSSLQKIKQKWLTILLVTIIHKPFETNSSFHVCEIVHYGKSSISVFQEIFASTDKIFISGGRIITRQQFYKVLRFSRYLIVS